MNTTLDYFATLRSIATELGSVRGFQASLKTTLGLIAQRHAFVRPHLVIFDPETRTLRLCVAETSPRASQVVYAPGVGITGQVFSTGQPVIVERILGHPVFLCKFFERTPEEMARLAFLSVPVLANTKTNESRERQVIGVLSTDTPCASHEELEMRCRFLEVAASMIATQATFLIEEMSKHMPAPIADAEDPSEKSPFVAVSKKMRMVLEQATRAGQSRSPVWLRGEPGTGKERLASIIHAASSRRDLAMVRFQCQGVTENMAERELFGYRKGAFPGATQTHKGLFELARSSDLFLEDVENLPVAIQTKIAKALQEQEFVRVGGGQPIDVEMRLICSSTRPLERWVEDGRFSQELYNRIAALPILLPPLRDRSEDILPLALHFLKQSAEAQGKAIERISTSAQDMLMAYTWPGNIWELQQCMEHAVHTCEDTAIRSGHLPVTLQSAIENSQLNRSFNDAVSRFEQELLTDALQRAKGNMLQAARDLQASYRIINYKVKKYNIDPRKFVGK